MAYEPDLRQQIAELKIMVEQHQEGLKLITKALAYISLKLNIDGDPEDEARIRQIISEAKSQL
ncbi:hypothetical protein CCAX7_15010 [Capsulimonas corticalis]|uniref:Uncharacterized protein n=1 Tax=Capsulimonas corticalis TaxID=2219043 RepID=A0A402CZD2_9BACT|nr:hypothetical protein [Capsulimonas corticalis]BDI29450.1 hypothetical protein CCAX7_15010 [Capsulimonas corticalis]